ncbi:MAG TPA: biotin/lipoyl-binding protein [Solirubrobacteraceae bacterium]|jgi:multidrug efflux pump subunit AcrA (membrane-fusion protein)|nr:biotin/lipoyl-binding protein [Solirubrobacteraceae bacterium]
MTDRKGASWLVYALGALCTGAIVAAVLVVGPASGSQTSVTRTATVAQGVVQSTVSGSGNLQAVNQLNLGFKTGGAVTHIYVSQGQQVVQGQLLATLDPQSAEVTLEQARASLLSDEANLAKEEETGGESGSSASGGGGGATASSAATAPKREPKKSTTERESKESNTGGSSAKAAISAATREANLASARAAVRSATLTVQSDEQAVQDTNLYAPESGTIVSLSGQVGEVVSGSGTTRASSAASSSSGSGGSGTGATGASGRGATAAASSSGSAASSSSSSSSAFAVLSDLSTMQLVVPLSESEIGSVKNGQIATVTVEALSGTKLAAHVSEVALLSTSSSGTVSYDVTFQLDQLAAGLKLGMSATAEVVVKQAEGINVPTSAITADTVTVERGGKQVRQRVVTGLAGNTSTIVLSGLKAGETVVLPAASTTSSSATNIISRISRLGGGGGGGLGGAAGLGGGGGGGAFLRGGG